MEVLRVMEVLLLILNIVVMLEYFQRWLPILVEVVRLDILLIIIIRVLLVARIIIP